MAIRIIIIIFIIFVSCAREPERENKESFSGCRFDPPKEIFEGGELTLQHSFRLEADKSFEYVEFKKTFNPPFKSLIIEQEGCDNIIQTFKFEGGEDIFENFLFLGSLSPEYVIYGGIANQLKKIKIIYGQTIELAPNFFIKVEKTTSGQIAVMGSVQDI